MNNLHISLTEFRNESRVIKETNSLVKSGLVKKVYIASLHSGDLKEKEQLSERVTLKRFALWTRSWPKNVLAQGCKYFEFCYRVYKEYREKDIKIVNIHALGLLPLGVLLKYLFKAKLIYDTHELETEVNGINGFRKSLRKFIEKRLIKYVDLTFVVSENIADWYQKEYNIERPPVIFNAPMIYEPQSNDIFREKLSISTEQIIFLYQGGLSAGRGILLLLESFKARTDNKAVIVFMGYGQLEEEIKNAEKQYENIFFYPAVSPHIVLAHTESADIGFSIIENTCLSYYFCMPNKLFEYAMAGLPVIVSNMKEMSEFVKNNQMGVIAEELTVTGINEAVDYMLTLDILTLKKNSREKALLHSWAVQEVKMLNAYEELMVDSL